MNIMELPMLVAAFAEIDADNGNFTTLNEAYVVPKKWHNHFLTTEGILLSLKGKTVRGLLGKKLNTKENRLTFEALFRKDLKPMPGDNDALLNVVLPCNDADELLLKAHGCSDKVTKMVQEVFYQYFDGKLSKAMHMTLKRLRGPKVVVVLEVMWGERGQRPLRWFDINPLNHSGRRLIDIVGSGNFTVTNACSDIVYDAKHRGTPDKAWLEANLRELAPDVLLVCGKVAQATFARAMAPKARVIALPHPAARTWSKATIEAARRKVSKAIEATAV